LAYFANITGEGSSASSGSSGAEPLYSSAFFSIFYTSINPANAAVESLSYNYLSSS